MTTRYGSTIGKLTNSLAHLCLHFIVLFGLPIAGSAELPPVDLTSRTSSSDYFNNYYCPGQTVAAEWQGDIEGGDAGSVSLAYETATLERINFFRRMAGVQRIEGFREEWSTKCREAALMMSANRNISHNPSFDWIHYSAAGAEALMKSNLVYGSAGPQAVSSLMYESDSGGARNYGVGHRRWLLHPGLREMGHGSVYPFGLPKASAIWVVGDADRDRVANAGAIMWPPAGYVPYALVFPRWSLSVDGADFSNAEVKVTREGVDIKVRLEALAPGYALNTLVWQLSDADVGTRTVDISYSVAVSNVIIDGQNRSFNYEVIQFDPAGMAETIQIDGRSRGKYFPAQFTLSVPRGAGCIGGTAKVELHFAPEADPTNFSLHSERPSGTSWYVSKPGRYKGRIRNTEIWSAELVLDSDMSVSEPQDEQEAPESGSPEVSQPENSTPGSKPENSKPGSAEGQVPEVSEPTPTPKPSNPTTRPEGPEEGKKGKEKPSRGGEKKSEEGKEKESENVREPKKKPKGDDEEQGARPTSPKEKNGRGKKGRSKKSKKKVREKKKSNPGSKKSKRKGKEKKKKAGGSKKMKRKSSGQLR